MTEKEILILISGWQQGEPKASRVLMEFAYIKIKEYAEVNYKSFPEDVNTYFHSLSVTDFAHDTYEKLLSAETKLPVETLREFYSYLNSAVRNLFVDHYRKHIKSKSNVIDKTSLTSPSAINQIDPLQEHELTFLALNQEMNDFSKQYPRQAEVLEFRYFAQKSNKEIARLLGVSLRTIENDVRFAKAWLKPKLARTYPLMQAL